MRRVSLHPAFALAVFALSPLAQAVSSDPTLARAEKLLEQRQAKSAFDLLAPLEDERAGNTDYDYLYGQAALESGQAGIAAFAFERCLAVDPKNGPCRVLMASTHLALGENSSARLELETVQSSQPPQEVQALVSQYLGTLAKQETSAKRRFGAYAQLGFGYDSNVTSTTPDSQIAIPALGGSLFTLNSISTKQEDSFLQGEAGANFEYALGTAWSLIGDAGLSTRRHTDVDAFDNQSATVSLGAARRAGAHSVVAKLQAQDYQLNDDTFRSLYGLLSQYQYTLGENAAVSAYVQASHFDNHYSGHADADRYVLGGGYSQAIGGNYSPVLYAGLYGGQEVSDVEDLGLGHDFYGLRLGGSLGVSTTLRLTGSLSAEQRKFDGQSMLFQVTRDDTAVDLGLGAIYQLMPHLSLRPAYTYSISDSNIVLSDYDRHVVAIDIRYDM